MILLTNIALGLSVDPIKIRNYQMSGDYINTARLSRSSLLGGGCSFSHYGVYESDRDLEIECRLSGLERELIKTMFANSDVIKIAYWEGFFLGYIYRLIVRRNGEANILFYFKEKLA